MTTDIRPRATVADRRPRPAAFSATSLREWHSYLSAFIAPMVLFFSFSGALQVLGLHERHGDARPNALIATMANIHKDQVLQGDHGGGPPAGARTGGAEPREPATPLHTRLLKWLFVLEAAILIATIGLGVWIGVTHPKRKARFWLSLAAGTVVPIVLLAI